MNIYLISQDRNSNWDTYDSFVAVSASEDLARKLLPEGPEDPDIDVWTDSEFVRVWLVGTADSKYEEGDILCTSFNAG